MTDAGPGGTRPRSDEEPIDFEILSGWLDGDLVPSHQSRQRLCQSLLFPVGIDDDSLDGEVLVLPAAETIGKLRIDVGAGRDGLSARGRFFGGNGGRDHVFARIVLRTAITRPLAIGWVKNCKGRDRTTRSFYAIDLFVVADLLKAYGIGSRELDTLRPHTRKCSFLHCSKERLHCGGAQGLASSEIWAPSQF